MLWTDENLMMKVSPDEIKTLRLTWKDYIKSRTQFQGATKQTKGQMQKLAKSFTLRIRKKV